MFAGRMVFVDTYPVRCAVVALTSLVQACQSLVVCLLHSIDAHRRGLVDAVLPCGVDNRSGLVDVF